MRAGPEPAAAEGRRRPAGFRVPKTAELIARWLRRRIHDQRLRPGDPLPSETELREEFAVSRPTVREALRILEAQQLVRIARGAAGGARYSLPDIGMVAEHTGIYLEAHEATQADLTEARLVIEPRIVAFIADHAGRADLDGLKHSVAAHREAMDDLARFTREHERFYSLLAEACPNRTLAMFLLILREIMAAQTDLLGEEILARGPRAGEAMEAHVRAKEKLLALIGKGDAAGAEALWRRHLEAQLRQLSDSGRGELRVKTA